MTRFDSLLARLARWPTFLGLTLLSAFWLNALTGMGAAADLPPLDTRLWYTPADVSAVMEALSPAQRDLAARAHLTLDVLFPLTYGLLLALLLARTWPERRLWRLAGAVVVADLMENGLLATLFWTHPRYLAVLTPMAATWTAIKWTLVALSVLLILVGAWRRWRSAA